MNFKIMIVDADEVFLQYIKKIFKTKFEVVTAGSTVDALGIIHEQGPFAVIVSNYNLAQIDGVQLLAMVKEFAPETRGILLTEIIESDMLAGAVNNAKIAAILTKPVLPEQMIYEVNKGIQAYNQDSRKMEFFKTLLKNEQNRLLEDKTKLLRYVETVETNVISTLLMLLYAHDAELANHCTQVAALAYRIAHELNLNERDAKQIKTAAQVHDIGKFCIEKEIRNKHKLSKPLELEILQSHVDLGCRLLRTLNFSWPLVTIVEQHHELLDGSGYPSGLKGDEIVFGSRIIAVANAVENIAVKSGSVEEALATIVNFQGSKFDQIIVEACVSLYSQHRLAED